MSADYSPYSEQTRCKCFNYLNRLDVRKDIKGQVAAYLGYPIRITGRIEKEGQ